MKFLYSSGQQPLDGYTIKRGIGRGGFGEVYYAVSDGGKEVALKLVNGNHEVELRGMAQCLNLKHNHLVNLYDIRTDSHGDHWVIMEYIAGESLGGALARHPNGLPRELVQQWFIALAKAVGYLHDHGIVHRDLKPANIFIENGIVKVGDYGLCKFISSSQRNAQTQSVGTVHYMAPEISTGNYNKQVDVYAAGVILYEMLTGKVPFDGESAGEILMKHLTSMPDLSALDSDYQTLVGKALMKNPAHRYGDLTEMAHAVEAVGKVDVLQEVSESDAPPKRNRRAFAAARQSEDVVVAAQPHTLRGQISELCGSLVFSAIMAAVATLLSTMVFSRGAPWAEILNGYFLTVAACWAVLVPAKLWASKRGDSWARRVIMTTFGIGVGILALYLDGWNPRVNLRETDDLRMVNFPMQGEGTNLIGSVAFYSLAFFALRWWKLTERRRPSFFRIGPMITASILSMALCLVLDDAHLWAGMLPLVATSAIVQLVSPWEAPAALAQRRVRLRYAG